MDRVARIFRSETLGTGLTLAIFVFLAALVLSSGSS